MSYICLNQMWICYLMNYYNGVCYIAFANNLFDCSVIHAYFKEDCFCKQFSDNIMIIMLCIIL